jgi:hypothetical protein
MSTLICFALKESVAPFHKIAMAFSYTNGPRLERLGYFQAAP